MSDKVITLCFFILLLSWSCGPHTDIPPDGASGHSGQWHDNKFSMFIHWGIYSIPGGVWNGEPQTGA